MKFGRIESYLSSSEIGKEKGSNAWDIVLIARNERSEIESISSQQLLLIINDLQVKIDFAERDFACLVQHHTDLGRAYCVHTCNLGP